MLLALVYLVVQTTQYLKKILDIQRLKNHEKNYVSCQNFQTTNRAFWRQLFRKVSTEITIKMVEVASVFNLKILNICLNLNCA